MPSLFLLALIGVPALIIGFIVIAFINTWLKAKLNGAPVGFANLLGMRLGGVPYNLVVDARITAVKAGIELSTDTIAAHFLAGGNVVPTIQALIAPRTQPADLARPGHISPLRYTEGGVLKRAGHTEAAVDLSRLAGMAPAGVLCEIVNDDGTIPRTAEINWDTFNSFRSGALSNSDGLSAPDLLIGESDDCQITCGTDGQMLVYAHVGNLGASDVPAGTTVQLYTKIGGVETLSGTAILEVGVPAGHWADGVAVTATGVDAATVESIVLKVVSNESECDDTNNSIEVAGPFCQ